jgi:hypothetical protein
MDKQLDPFFLGPNDGFFGVEEQLVHVGVHLSQRLNIFETQCTGTETCGSNSHWDEKTGD